MAVIPGIDPLDLIAPERYGANGPPHEAWTWLREHSPVHRCEPAGYQSFHAVTRAADIMHASSHPEVWSNAQGIVLLNSQQLEARDRGDNPIGQMRTIIEMDPPEHRDYRKVASGFFTPRGITLIEDVIRRSARGVVDALGEEGEADFVERVSQRHPLRVLATILGIGTDVEERLIDLTQQLFASEDPELQRQGVDRTEAQKELGLEFYLLFNSIIEDRRANPRDDLATMLATATLESGEPLGPLETLGYYLIVFTAGHDTTRNALSGAAAALIDHPGELRRLQQDRSLLKTAADEVVRWSSPVNYMVRTALADTELHGVPVAEGERIVQFYGSANRDDDLFDDPFRFDVGRPHNRHLGFGWAEHYCLGTHLARASITALLDELASRVEVLEESAPRQQIASSFVIGLKHLPVRYRIRPAAG